MRLLSSLPAIATMTIARRKPGKDMVKSMNLMRKRSVFPPMYPETAPMVVPSVAESIVASSAIFIVVCDPKMNLDMRSLPWLSVPSQCNALGCSSPSNVEVVAEYGQNIGPSTASARMSDRQIVPMSAGLWFLIKLRYHLIVFIMMLPPL